MAGFSVQFCVGEQRGERRLALTWRQTSVFRHGWISHTQDDIVHSRALDVLRERDRIFGGLGLHPLCIYLTLLNQNTDSDTLRADVTQASGKQRHDERRQHYSIDSAAARPGFATAAVGVPGGARSGVDDASVGTVAPRAGRWAACGIQPRCRPSTVRCARTGVVVPGRSLRCPGGFGLAHSWSRAAVG